MQILLFLIPSIVVFYVCFFNLCDIKFKPIELGLGMLVTYSVIVCISFISIENAENKEILVNLSMTTCLVIFMFCKRKRIWLSLFYAMLTTVTLMVGGNLVTVLFTYILNIFLEEQRESWLTYLSGSAISFVISFTVTRILGNYLRRNITALTDDLKNKFAKSVLLGLVILLPLFYINVYAHRTINDRFLLEAILITLIMLFYIFLVVAVIAFTNSTKYQLEAAHARELLDQYIGASYLEDIQTEIRQYHHDLVNILSPLYGYLEKGDLEKATEYFNTHVASIDSRYNSLIATWDCLGKVRIPEIKGLLSIKFAYAWKTGIPFLTDIYDPIEPKDITFLAMDKRKGGDILTDLAELCRMVGIIMDNAIEECHRLKDSGEHDSPRLTFGIVKKGEDIMFICSNTVTAPPPGNKMFENGYSTKGNHLGLGLFTLQQLSNKYKNVLLRTEFEDSELTQIITVYHW